MTAPAHQSCLPWSEEGRPTLGNPKQQRSHCTCFQKIKLNARATPKLHYPHARKQTAIVQATRLRAPSRLRGRHFRARALPRHQPLNKIMYMSHQKPFSPSAERNKRAIAETLRTELADNDLVLEYGSGTGQHLVHFAQAMPCVQWYPSDLPEQLPGIMQWISESNCTNLHQAIELDLRSPAPPNIDVSACYTANTFHIISWECVQNAFKCSAALLDDREKLLVYGPFSVNGQHNSPGNRAFDQQLRSNHSQSGIRDLYELDKLAIQHGFSAAKSTPMPANNQLLVWVREKNNQK